jgi:hypothetical protein
VVVDIDVFCPFIELGVLGEGEAGLVVTIEEWRVV